MLGLGPGAGRVGPGSVGARRLGLRFRSGWRALIYTADLASSKRVQTRPDDAARARATSTSHVRVSLTLSSVLSRPDGCPPHTLETHKRSYGSWVRFGGLSRIRYFTPLAPHMILVSTPS